MTKIVIVDDDPSIQEGLKLIFSDDEFDVAIYSDGNSLLEAAVPDIYVIDKQLSGVDGLDLCRMLKANPQTKHIPVIMLSASPGIRRLASEAGADHVIEKPFRIQTLRDAVKQHVKA